MYSDYFKNKQANYKIITFSVLFIFGFLLVRFWHITWDDSAITLGFSRNLIKYNDIIPSQFSDRVEGFSTFLWMIINSIFFLLGFSSGQVLLFAKLLSTSLTILNIVLFGVLVGKKISDSVYQILALTLYVLNTTTIGAAVFGMETSLYGTLVLASYFLYLKRKHSLIHYVTFSFFSSLLVLIRHEGALFLIPFVLANYFYEPRRFFKEPFIYYWILVFIAYHIWHYRFFGEILTNPMMAKRYWPYHPIINSPFDAVIYYINPIVDFVSHYIVVFILLTACFLWFRNRFSGIIRWNVCLDVSLWIGIVGLFIMFITGDRSGAAQRLSYPALPFMLLILFQLVDKAPFRMIAGASRMAVLFIIFGLITNLFYITNSFDSLKSIVTVADVQEIAHTVTLTQEFLQKDVVTYAAPDMGGTILFEGDGKRIIDLGLLCDSRLGKSGYGELEEYVFQEEKPAIIEAHEFWLQPLEASKSFYKMYYPTRVLTNDNQLFLFIRRDIVDDLVQKHLASNIPYMNVVKTDFELNAVLSKFGEYAEIDLQ